MTAARTRARTYRILWGILAWDVSMLIPTAIKLVVELHKRNAMYFFGSGRWWVLVIAVSGIAIGSICSLAATYFRGAMAGVVGFVLGAGCVMGLGWELASHGGFEAQSLFMLSAVYSIPSGIGGAIAGWLNRRLPVQR